MIVVLFQKYFVVMFRLLIIRYSFKFYFVYSLLECSLLREKKKCVSFCDLLNKLFYYAKAKKNMNCQYNSFPLCSSCSGVRI